MQPKAADLCLSPAHHYQQTLLIRQHEVFPAYSLCHSSSSLIFLSTFPYHAICSIGAVEIRLTLRHQNTSFSHENGRGRGR
jgi:hypothetical protein